MDAIKQAEDYLSSSLRYNLENAILPSENIVIKRLLNESAELRRVWIELGKKAHNLNFKHAIDGIVSTAAFWSPEKTSEIRESKRICDEEAAEIRKKSLELAALLDKHNNRRGRTGLSTPIQVHPIDCMTEWARCDHNGDGYLFINHIKPKLDQLQYQYDFKYWPTISDCLRGIASQDCTEYIDATTSEATSSRESSKADFIRALWSRLAEQNINLTNSSMAAITNCALSLVDSPYSEESMKKAIQRIKKGTTNGEFFY